MVVMSMVCMTKQSLKCLLNFVQTAKLTAHCYSLSHLLYLQHLQTRQFSMCKAFESIDSHEKGDAE